MPELNPPEQISFEDIGITISEHDIALLSTWITLNATRKRNPHASFETLRDTRDYSYIRKFSALLNSVDARPPTRIESLTRELYEAAMEPFATYLGATLVPLQSRYAAAAHLYLPGDEPSEGHIDYYPSVNFYLKAPSKGGELLIAKSKYQSNLELIREDAYHVQPEPRTLILFSGTVLPHFVDRLPATAIGVRAGINATYWDGSRPESTHTRWTQQ